MRAHDVPSVLRRVFRRPFVAACMLSLALAGFLLTWRLDQVPPYLSQDEAAIGLGSYLIATTGRDFWGNLLPLDLACFDEVVLNPAMIAYWAIPFVSLLGFSVTTIRIAAATLGLLTGVLFGLVSWRLSRNPWVGLAGSWLLWTTPLFFIQSRFLMQLFAITFIVAWLGCLVECERRGGDERFLVAGAMVLGLGYYSYTTTRALMPILLAATILAYYWRGRCSRTTAGTSVLLLLLLLLPSAIFAITNPQLTQARFLSTSWWKTGMPIGDAVSSFAGHYLATFDVADLFVSGDSSLIHSTQQAGTFLAATVPLAALGMVKALRHCTRGEPLYISLVVALLAAPLPVSLMAETHRPFRVLYVVAIYGFLAVLGLGAISSRMRTSRGLAAGMAIVAAVWLFQAGAFLHDYFTAYPQRAAASGLFNGNKPLAFQLLMEESPAEVYVDREDPLVSTYLRFFQHSSGYSGATYLVQPESAGDAASGALLLTRRPHMHPDFLQVSPVPEIPPGTSNPYWLMRRGSRSDPLASRLTDQARR